MSFLDAVESCLRQSTTFSGRARRSEYWWFELAQLVVVLTLVLAGSTWFAVVVVAGELDLPRELLWPAAALGAVQWVAFATVSLGLLVPWLAVTARRLHDAGFDTWLVALVAVPGGSYVLLALAALPGVPGPNVHGPDPRQWLTAPDPRRRGLQPAVATRRRGRRPTEAGPASPARASRSRRRSRRGRRRG